MPSPLKKTKRKSPIPSETRVISALRKVWRWDKQRRIVKEHSKTLGGYKCSVCLETVPRIEIDHLHDMAGLIRRTGNMKDSDWQTYIERLFCSASEMRPVCPPCHRRITAAQRKARKKA